MAMKLTSLRLSENLYEELERRAEEMGVSVAQYIRESLIAQMAWERGLETGRAMVKGEHERAEIRELAKIPTRPA